MRGKTGKAFIGLFVLGALALLVAGVVMFGSGKLFVPSKKYVMYFDGSVKGLSVGAPVVFRGVKVGSVIDIVLQGNLHDMLFTVPVIVEVDLSRFQIVGGESVSDDLDKALIERGLRAQLQPQSLVTGQLVIDVDFRPGRPMRVANDTTGLPQIPTIPSTAEELAQKLEELPLQQLVNRLNELVGGLERLANSPDMQNVPQALNQAIGEMHQVFATIDREVALLAAEARDVLVAVTETVDRVDRTLSFQEGAPAEMVDNLNQFLNEARHSLAAFDQTLESVRSTLGDERSAYELRHALRELRRTAQTLGVLADSLDRQPDILLWGKPVEEEP